MFFGYIAETLPLPHTIIMLASNPNRIKYSDRKQIEAKEKEKKKRWIRAERSMYMTLWTKTAMQLRLWFFFPFLETSINSTLFTLFNAPKAISLQNICDVIPQMPQTLFCFAMHTNTSFTHTNYVSCHIKSSAERVHWHFSNLVRPEWQ